MSTERTFGPWLRRLRDERGLTRAALAQQVGCSAAFIRKLEDGERRPSQQVAERLARFLQLSPQDWAQFLKAARRRPYKQASQPGASSTSLNDRPATGGAQANLRRFLTPLIGREHDLALLAELVLRPETRLVSLLGPPGVGKTRLGVELAERMRQRFSHGACLVALAPVVETGLVASTIAQALGLRESRVQPIEEQLVAALQGKQLLLLLDNFEQIIDAAGLLAKLLKNCPDLTLLVTSREPLRLRGEQHYRVAPLAFPPENLAGRLSQHIDSYPAVALFIDRARAYRPEFDLTAENAVTIAAICRRLDGLPLALELVAAWIKIFSLPALLRRLSDSAARQSLGLLSRGPRDLPARQRTLRAAIAWSYDLLPVQEQSLFAALGLFAGGFTAEATTAVCGADDEQAVVDRLASLQDKGLLQCEPGQEAPRFSLLETIREYALEQLERSGQAAAHRARFISYYLNLAEEAEPALEGVGQRAWLERLDHEHANVQAALRQALDGDQAVLALRLGCALQFYWVLRNRVEEGRRWVEQALGAPGETPATLRARALCVLGGLNWFQGRYGQASACYQESIDRLRELGDEQWYAKALNGLANVLAYQNFYTRAIPLFEESLALARRLGDRRAIAVALTNLGNESVHISDYNRAQALFEEALALWQAVGDQQGLAIALHGLGSVTAWRCDYPAAWSLYTQALSIWRELDGLHGVTVSLNDLGRLTAKLGLLRFATGLLQDALAVARAQGYKRHIATSLCDLGLLALQGTDYEAARGYFTESLELRYQHGEQDGITRCLEGLAVITAVCEHAVGRAGVLLGAAERLRELTGSVGSSEQFFAEHLPGSLKESIDMARFAQAKEQGRALPLEEIVALALDGSARSAPADEVVDRGS